MKSFGEGILVERNCPSKPRSSLRDLSDLCGSAVITGVGIIHRGEGFASKVRNHCWIRVSTTAVAGGTEIDPSATHDFLGKAPRRR